MLDSGSLTTNSNDKNPKRISSQQLMRRRESLSLFNIAVRNDDTSILARQMKEYVREEDTSGEIDDRLTELLRFQERINSKKSRSLNDPSTDLTKPNALSHYQQPQQLQQMVGVVLPSTTSRTTANTKLCFTVKTFENYFEQRPMNNSMHKRASLRALESSQRRKMLSKIYLFIFFLFSISFMFIFVSFLKMINK